ncbi:hypothetical protein [Roseicyclus sp.]
MAFTFTDIVAGYAALVATAVFFLELRRWVEDGPRLVMGVMSDAQMVGGAVDKKNEYFVLNAANAGNLPTTITHVVILDYGNRWNYLRGKPAWQAIIPRPTLTDNNSPPYVLRPGETWVGMVNKTANEELETRRANGWLYIGIYASHSRRCFGKLIKRKGV